MMFLLNLGFNCSFYLSQTAACEWLVGLYETWNVQEQEELPARPCSRLLTTPDLTTPHHNTSPCINTNYQGWSTTATAPTT